MIGRTNALRAAQGGVTEGEKPAAAYSGKWTGWRLAFYKGGALLGGGDLHLGGADGDRDADGGHLGHRRRAV